MSKRKPTTASKRTRGRKIGAQPQRARQDVVRGPKDNYLHDVPPGPTESLGGPKPEALVIENNTSVLQADVPQTVTSKDSGNGSDFFSAITHLQAYQAKIFEMTQANVQLAFEFTQRIAGTSSPFEILAVLVEFASKPIDMFQKYSKEMTELNTRRLTL